MKDLRLHMKKDKLLVQEIINLFLGEKSIEEIATETQQTIDFVICVLDYQKMIVEHFGEDIWNQIVQRKKKLNQQRKEKEYEQNMENILYYVIHSLYNYMEMQEFVFMNESTICSMLSNTEYIEKKFGKQILEKALQMMELRKKIFVIPKSNKYIVKAPELRKIIQPDVIRVSQYEYSLIEKVSLFFKFGGDSMRMNRETSFSVNDIMLSLRTPNLEKLLTDSAYAYLQTLLNVECILTQNRLDECRTLVTDIVLLSRDEHGIIENILEISEYPKCLIERILNHPYSNVVCNKYGIDRNDIELKNRNTLDEATKLVLDIADYIIKNNASYRSAAVAFSLGKTTVGKYMSKILPNISKSKYDKVHSIIELKTTTGTISKIVEDRINLEYALLMRGYRLGQIGFLVNNSYGSTQRDLTGRLSRLAPEKAQEAKKVLYKHKHPNK